MLEFCKVKQNRNINPVKRSKTQVHNEANKQTQTQQRWKMETTKKASGSGSD